MSIKINTNNGTAEPFTVILSNRDHTHLGEILNISGIRFTDYLNRAKELCFKVDKYADGVKERLWDEITDLKIVYVKEINTYFEINVSAKSGSDQVKNVTGKSLCECELSQKDLYNIEINTEDDIARADYVPAQFYNPNNPKASLLHRILSETPAYTVKHVDASLMPLQRSFSVNGKSVYDFLTGDCGTEFNCLFRFDSVDRTISVYDLSTRCGDCGYRGDFSDTCPKCGGHNLQYFGEDTTILVSADNLTDEIQFETDIDNVKNCFVLEAGDESMTAAVMSYLPGGGNKLFYVPPCQQKDMPAELAERIGTYNALYDSLTGDYHDITAHIYECIERITYHTSRQMPEVTLPDITAANEAAKLTTSNLSPLSLTSLTTHTSLATINSALVNYAKVFVRSGFVKIETESGSFTYHGESNGVNSGTWTGKIKITSYANKEDVAYSGSLTIAVNDDYQSFINASILKNIADNNTEDGSVYDVLKIKNLNDFRNALKLYCLNRLISFRDAVNGVLNVLLEENGGDTESELYAPFYSQYYEKLQACNAEINLRRAEIEKWEKRREQYEAQKQDIQRRLDFRNYLGSRLYNIFTTYIRESKYSNSHYISDGLTDDRIFELAQEFLENARRELVKSSYYQHSIRANLYNLLLLEEFSPIADKFRLGNWIRVEADEEIYRLRLVSYAVDFDSLSTINTEFSDVTRTANGMNDVHDILKQAGSMASSYAYVSRQASNGDDAKNVLHNFVAEGLNSASVNLKNNDQEEIILDKNGLTARSYDDITDGYGPEQLRITHNLLAYTADDFRTVKCALGKHQYYKYINDVLVRDTAYGLTADFVTAGVVNGSQIIAGDIYSANYSPAAGTHFDLNNGTFTLADGKICFDGQTLKLKGTEIDWSTTNESAATQAAIKANTNQIASEVKRATNMEGSLSTRITQTANEIKASLEDTAEGLQHEITASANGLEEKISASDGRITSIQKTADGIKETIENPENGLRAQIKKNAEGVEESFRKVNDAEGRLNESITSIRKTAEGIYADIYDTNGLKTQIQATAEGLSSKVERNGVISAINQTAEEASINASKINFNGLVTANNYFKIHTNGMMECNGGEIANFTIYDDKLMSSNNGKVAGIGTCGYNWAFFAGNYNSSLSEYDFCVGHEGYIYCESVDARKYMAGYKIESRIYNDMGQRNIYGFRGSQGQDENANWYGYSDWFFTDADSAGVADSSSSGEIFGSAFTYQDGFELYSKRNIRICASKNLELYAGDGTDNHSASNGTDTGEGSAPDAGLDAYSGSYSIELHGDVNYYGAFAAGSSRRYKENITEITEEDADAVLRLVPVEFDYKETGRHSTGLIAEDTYDILPQIVGLKDGRPDNIDYIKLIPYLLKKIQMQERKIKALTEHQS